VRPFCLVANRLSLPPFVTTGDWPVGFSALASGRHFSMDLLLAILRSVYSLQDLRQATGETP
jgi:hypothetical protein